LGTAASKLNKPASRSLFATGIEDSELTTEVKYGENDTMKVTLSSVGQPVAAQLRSTAPPAPAKAAAPKSTTSANLPIGKAVGCPEGHERQNGHCVFTAQNLNQVQSSAEFDANIAPEKIHTLIPEAYRTVANDGSYVFNLGEKRTTFFAQNPNAPPEKIETHEDPHASHHTTYYGQQALSQAEPFNANIEPEKVQTLIPEAYRTQENVINRNPSARTTFYAQDDAKNNTKDGSLIQFDANIEPEKIHTLIPEAYRTLANQGSYVFNLGEQRSTFFNQLDSDLQYDE
jgi:hypothetical protein